MLGVEIDMVVKDSLAAVALYEAVFQVERVEIGDFVQGQNEVVINIFGTRFHLLDENDSCGLVAPKPGNRSSIWFNILVSDIKDVYEKGQAQGFSVVQPLTEMADMGIRVAMLADPFGYVWMISQIDREVSYEDRVRYFEQQGFERRK